MTRKTRYPVFIMLALLLLMVAGFDSSAFARHRRRCCGFGGFGVAFNNPCPCPAPCPVSCPAPCPVVAIPAPCPCPAPCPSPTPVTPCPSPTSSALLTP